MRKILSILFLLGVAGCGNATPSVWLPPDSLIHPYAGTLHVNNYHYHGGPWLAGSIPLSAANTCIMTIPIADSVFSVDVRHALYLAELGHCNQGDDAYRLPDPNDEMRVLWPKQRLTWSTDWTRQWTQVDLNALCSKAGGCP